MTIIEPYLFFYGRCQEAVDFYIQTLGVQVESLMHYSDSPEPVPEGNVPPNWGGKIMHATIRIPNGPRIMMSDGHLPSGPNFQGFALSLALPTAEEASATFTALAATGAGAVVMPMSPTFWSPAFGMVTDRFGVLWMITVDTDQSEGNA